MKMIQIGEDDIDEDDELQQGWDPLILILKIFMWILVKMILTKMMSCSWGGIHWSVALSASNDSSFATLNALNTSYIQYSIPDTATFNAISNDVFTMIIPTTHNIQ